MSFQDFGTCYKYFSADLVICTLVLKWFDLLLCFGLLLGSYCCLPIPSLLSSFHVHLLTSCFLVSDRTHLMYCTSCISIFRF